MTSTSSANLFPQDTVIADEDTKKPQYSTPILQPTQNTAKTWRTSYATVCSKMTVVNTSSSFRLRQHRIKSFKDVCKGDLMIF